MKTIGSGFEAFGCARRGAWVALALVLGAACADTGVVETTDRRASGTSVTLDAKLLFDVGPEELEGATLGITGLVRGTTTPKLGALFGYELER